MELLFPNWLQGLGEAQERSKGAALSSSHEEGPGVVVTVIYYLRTPRKASRK